MASPSVDFDLVRFWLAVSLAFGSVRPLAAAEPPVRPGDWRRLAALINHRNHRRAPHARGPALATLQHRAALLARQAGTCVPRGSLLVYSTPEYPGRLRNIADPPAAIWVSGDPGALADPAIAMVGARAASGAALAAGRRIARELSLAGFTIVSGMARGVDAAVHAGALESGRTVAVLGSGVNVVYPPEHQALAARIVERGALISEFPPGTPPRRHHFPLRNRLVAGLSLGVVIVEAGETSGSLITAHAALDQGKDVMVVPGPALGRNRGGHRLIQDGAALVEHARDILEVLNPGMPTVEAPGPQPLAVAIQDLPSRPDGAAAARLPPGWHRGEELEVDEIQQLTRTEPASLLAGLVEWELAGLVVRTPAGTFVRL